MRFGFPSILRRAEGSYTPLGGFSLDKGPQPRIKVSRTMELRGGACIIGETAPRIVQALSGIPGQGLAMAIVDRSAHRWWVRLVAIGGALLATAHAPAREMGRRGDAVVRGFVRCVSEIRSAGGAVLDTDRMLAPLQRGVQARPGPLGHFVAMPDDRDGRASVPLRTGAPGCFPSRAVVGHLSGGVRPDGDLIPRSNRCGRSRIDADEQDGCIAGDDDTDMPLRVWLRDMVRCIHDPILPESDAVLALNDSPSASFDSLQPLRC